MSRQEVALGAALQSCNSVGVTSPTVPHPQPLQGPSRSGHSLSNGAVASSGLHSLEFQKEPFLLTWKLPNILPMNVFFFPQSDVKSSLFYLRLSLNELFLANGRPHPLTLIPFMSKKKRHFSSYIQDKVTQTFRSSLFCLSSSVKPFPRLQKNSAESSKSSCFPLSRGQDLLRVPCHDLAALWLRLSSPQRLEKPQQNNTKDNTRRAMTSESLKNSFTEGLLPSFQGGHRRSWHEMKRLVSLRVVHQVSVF